MQLTKSKIQKLRRENNVFIPPVSACHLPEKVLQFGTGVLLKGLPDFLIHKANCKGKFNGSIVMVKSTGNGDCLSIKKQDGLYTVCVRGIKEGKKINENHIVSSVSRCLSAKTEWDIILEVAANPEMQVVISNTTEVGIELVKDNIHNSPPVSFPGKLLAFLYQRFKIFNGDISKGMVIIPTELIPGNADKLLSIVLELAHQNGLEIAFIDWLENANEFCNSLVDRIVPGKLKEEEQAKIETELGYKDEDLIMSESYALWAIESSSEKVKSILSFADDEEGVIIEADINRFRELKLRLLNASHSFSAGLAVLAGFDTVKHALDNKLFENFLQNLMVNEIIPCIVNGTIREDEALRFAQEVLDRYRNEFIEHKWLSITMQYSSKMYMRTVELIKKYIQRFEQPAPHMTLGMAAHILFMKSTASGNLFQGEANGEPYTITDNNAHFYAEAWQAGTNSIVVKTVLNNTELWGIDLCSLPGFEHEVNHWLNILVDKGPVTAMELAISAKKILVDEEGLKNKPPVVRYIDSM